MKRRLVFVFSMFVLVALHNFARGENWPGWRGDGNAVSNESNLPEVWDVDNKVRWKTRIEGDGISSPIVWGDKVFLTTAVKGSQNPLFKLIVPAICTGFLILAAVFAIRGRSVGWQKPAGTSIGAKFLRWLDKDVAIFAAMVLVTAAGYAFFRTWIFEQKLSFEGKKAILVVTVFSGLLLLALVFSLAAVRKRTPVFLRVVAHWVDRAIAILAALLFAVGMYELGWLVVESEVLFKGDVAGAWIVSSSLSVLGLVAAIGYLNPRSPLRLAGLVLLVGATVFFHAFIPLRVGSNPVPLAVQMAVTAPLALMVAWCLFMFSFSISGDTAEGIVLPKARLFVTGSLMAAALLSFTFMNYFKAEEGLWRSVVCIDRDSGRILWLSECILAPTGRKYRSNSYATPTPVTDGEHIVAYYGPGIVCLDLDGNIKWTRMEPKFSEYVRYGASSSPVIHGNKVIYAFMPENGETARVRGMDFDELSLHSYLTAVDKETGKELWRVDDISGAHDSYGTPLVVSGGERAAVLISTYDHCFAYDVESGEELWKVMVPLAQPVPSFVADENRAYLTGGIHGPEVAAAIRLGGKGDITDTHVDWKITKGVTGVSSPVLYEGLLYWTTENGIVNCVDAENGKVVWKKRIVGAYLASPVAGDGKVYLPSEDGKMTVIRAGRKFKLVATNSIGEECYSSPAISAGDIFIRGKEHLFCVSGLAERTP